MRIISLNTWGGRAGKEGLLNFFQQHADTADIFCLQEIWSAPYKDLEGSPAGGEEINNERIMVYGLQEISTALPSHSAFFRPHYLDNYGLLMMVKKDLSIAEEGEAFVYKEKGFVPSGDAGYHARNIQYVTIETVRGVLTVINFHGLWNGKGKGDSQERVEQSEKILDFTEKLQNPFVLCGDFNLLPATESIRKFENKGLRNLIKEYGVTTTRTSFYNKPEKFADYAFVSEGMVVKDFRVLPDEVSDHAPLLIEVE